MSVNLHGVTIKLHVAKKRYPTYESFDYVGVFGANGSTKIIDGRHIEHFIEEIAKHPDLSGRRLIFEHVEHPKYNSILPTPKPVQELEAKYLEELYYKELYKN